jgi:hypothetical protein
MSKTLTIDVPEALYARLERRAQMNQRSLDDEVIHVLEATTDVDVDREALWERIRRRRQRLPTVAWDPEELKRKIREGRK